MSIESRSNQYGTVFEHWQIQEALCHRTDGKTAVFSLKRNDSFRDTSAMKVISLIEERGRYDDLPAYRKKEYNDALKECMAKATPEVEMMCALRGNTNIVDYMDHKFHNWSDSSGFGCDLLIRMELLEDLRTIIRKGKIFSEKEILKIGRDIGTALVLCHRHGIHHRDIKPENIMVNKEGNYKLGDFGISRLLDASPMVMASTGRCTPEYAAPEQFNRHHDARSDIYSLGLVLYELRNRNKLPFANSSYVRQEDVEKRQRGIPFPKPDGISAGFWRVIQKACAYKAEDRYQTADAFLSDLNNLSGISETLPSQLAVQRNVTQKAVPMSNGNSTQKASADYISEQDYFAAFGVDELQRVFSDDISKATPNDAIQGEHDADYSTERRLSGRTRNKPKKNNLSRIISMVAALVILVTAGFFITKHLVMLKEIASIIDDSEAMASAEDFVGAIAKIEDGLDKYSDAENLKDKLNEYQEALKNQQITAILTDAAVQAEQENYEAALTIISAGLDEHPDSSNLHSKYDEYDAALAEQQINFIISEAEGLAAKEDYENAFAKVQSCLLSYPDSEALQEKSEEYSVALDAQIKQKNLSEAEAFADSGDYVAAITLIKKAQEDHGNDADYQNAYNTYRNRYKADAVASAEDFAENGDYLSAIHTVNTAIDIVGEDEELKKQKQLYEDAYVSDVVAQIDSYLDSKNFDSATTTLNEALEHFPNNTVLVKERKRIEDRKPKYLLDVVKPYETPYHYEDHNGTPFSMGGQSYKHGFICMGYGDRGYGNLTYFNLAGKYDEISFVAGIVDGEAPVNGESIVFSIAVDGTVVDSFEMNVGDLPVLRTVSISGCKQLVISVYSHQSTAFYDGRYGIAEIKVS